MTYDLPSKRGYAQMLEGWTVNSIFTAQTGTPLFLYDSTNDISGIGAFNDHWNITGDPRVLNFNHNKPIPYYGPDQFNTVPDAVDPADLSHAVSGTNPTSQGCFNQAFAMGGQAGADQLIDGPDGSLFGGCYVLGGTILTPPAPGTFGNMKRNVVYGPGYVNMDFSVIKHFKIKERFSLELRGEFFNVLNHPNFADPDHDLTDSDPDTVGVSNIYSGH